VAASPAATTSQEADASAPGTTAEGPGQRSRRRRRRRGRRGGGSAAAIIGTPASPASADGSAPVDANAPIDTTDLDEDADDGPEVEAAEPADHSTSESLIRRPAELPPATEPVERDAAPAASAPPSAPVETPAAESRIEPSPGSDPDAQ
jgi:hypothetical protein